MQLILAAALAAAPTVRAAQPRPVSVSVPALTAFGKPAAAAAAFASSELAPAATLSAPSLSLATLAPALASRALPLAPAADEQPARPADEPEADAASAAANFDGSSARGDAPAADPPYYAQKPSAGDRVKTRPYTPTAADTEQARREYLALAEAGEEIFNAPTWFEKGEYPKLKKAIFAVALIDEALTDVANGQQADVPEDVGSDVVSELLVRRAQAMAEYHVEIARIQDELGKPKWTETRARENARIRLEHWHTLGLVAPILEKPVDQVPAEYRVVAETYQKMREIAAGRVESSQREVNALAELYTEGLRSSIVLKKARAIDIVLASARKTRASAAEAREIYNRSIKDARDPSGAENLEHNSARFAAMGSTIIPVPRTGKQIRPSCTMHMLASLLSSLGIKRDLTSLIKEARLILGDPFVAISTAFNYEQQVKLFRHYGRIAEARGNVFQSLVVHRRAIKVSIEIGDPVYKHSLIVEGFYELGGQTYIALVDSTSYFPTRMTVEDFGRIMTADDAVVMLEPLPAASGAGDAPAGG